MPRHNANTMRRSTLHLSLWIPSAQQRHRSAEQEVRGGCVTPRKPCLVVLLDVCGSKGGVGDLATPTGENTHYNRCKGIPIRSASARLLFSDFIFHLKLKSQRSGHEKTDFTLVQLLGRRGGDPMRQKDTSTGRRGQKRRGGGGSHSVSFELMSPCWAGFDIQTMRQGSTQGGRLPCNINSHLESSCGCGHETLKETAAMDPVPSHHRSHGLLQLPPHCSPKPA